jgi:MoaA/NifB/PqqE/SkfB family radical SAM enzyme
MKKGNQSPEVATKAPATLKRTLNKYDPKLASVFLPWILANGIKVPPFLILSITPRCNLHCTGCYAAATGTTCNEIPKKSVQTKALLNWEQWHAVIKEAGELGVFGFVIAGGEPFLFPGLLKLCKEFKDRFFLILTNGTTLGKEEYASLKRLGNIAILVSIEGDSEFTNARRGQGVYEKAMNTLKQLSKIGVICGISATITRMNYKYWMKPENIDHLIEQGIRIGTFIEYIPLTPALETESEASNQCMPSCIFLPDSTDNVDNWDTDNDHELMLTPKEREIFRSQMLNYRATKSIYIVHSPGDEEFFGGCVSAGRGFAHITPAGDLTPCPISNIATHNLTTSTLREALASPLFKEIRENEHLLETEGMPCALFAHPKEVDALAKAVGAYRTDIEKK